MGEETGWHGTDANVSFPEYSSFFMKPTVRTCKLRIRSHLPSGMHCFAHADFGINGSCCLRMHGGLV